jgi:hypothetical protein
MLRHEPPKIEFGCWITRPQEQFLDHCLSLTMGLTTRMKDLTPHDHSRALTWSGRWRT